MGTWGLCFGEEMFFCLELRSHSSFFPSIWLDILAFFHSTAISPLEMPCTELFVLRYGLLRLKTVCRWYITSGDGYLLL